MRHIQSKYLSHSEISVVDFPKFLCAISAWMRVWTEMKLFLTAICAFSRVNTTLRPQLAGVHISFAFRMRFVAWLRLGRWLLLDWEAAAARHRTVAIITHVHLFVRDKHTCVLWYIYSWNSRIIWHTTQKHPLRRLGHTIRTMSS